MSINFPATEEEVLKRWADIDAFQTQLKLSEGRPPYTFYDGPPFATGMPHYGHLLASTIKDVIPRYWSMKGFHVERRFGWDTHGLPIEHEIDKKHGKSGAILVKEIGIEQYNKECRAIVLRYAEEWRRIIGRLGRWIDFDNDYKTMNLSFMESVWWVFKQLHDKGQVYRQYRVMPFSTALSTPLSNFEENQNRKDTQDPAITVAFPLVHEPETSLLIWTTTPWTIPSNIAIAVHPNFEYIKIKDHTSGRQYVIMESLLSTLYKDVKKAKFTKLETIRGVDMDGWRYVPAYKYYYEANKDWWWRVYPADYVTADTGTGLVHQAPSFGAEDYNAAMKIGLITRDRLPPNPVDDQGCYTSEITDYAGEYVRGPVEKTIIKDLTQKGYLIVNSQVTHNVAFCWRSDTPLIQRAVSAWFVNVENIVPQMLQNISDSHWVPSFVKEKRFANWIASARDWNISRNRFWGTPIPIWADENFEEIVVIGSIAELKEKSGYQGEITDIHRDIVDQITIKGKNGNTLRRIPEVFDCWFESGSMPYASVHYPFSFADPSTFMNKFPGDFIAEGIDQTRGWFYTLVVLGTHLFGCSPFKNCIVNGIVLAKDGKKMSKSKKNFPDPMTVVDQFGSDALRLYLINSPVVRAEPIRFLESGVKEVVSRVLLPLWNSYQFFAGQAALLQKVKDVRFQFNPEIDVTKHGNIMDQWIHAKAHSLLQTVDREMGMYRLYTVVPALLEMIDDLTNWYIRLNRRRLKGEYGVQESIVGLNTLFEVLYFLVRSLAPFTPFITDHLYSLLKVYLPEKTLDSYADSRSVHFLPYPVFDPRYLDPIVERRLERMKNVIVLGRTSRERRTLGLKTPLKSLAIIHMDKEYLSDLEPLESYILDELNVQQLELVSDETTYNIQYSCSANWAVLGQKLRKDMPRVKKALAEVTSQQVKQFVDDKVIEVAGIKLTDEDLVVKREVGTADDQDVETNGDNDVLTILDVKQYPGLFEDGLAREIVNRVQRLRKKAGLVATDDVDMVYDITADPMDVNIAKVFESHATYFTNTFRAPLKAHESSTTTGRDKDALILEEEQDVQGARFLLSLLKI